MYLDLFMIFRINFAYKTRHTYWSASHRRMVFSQIWIKQFLTIYFNDSNAILNLLVQFFINMFEEKKLILSLSLWAAIFPPSYSLNYKLYEKCDFSFEVRFNSSITSKWWVSYIFHSVQLFLIVLWMEMLLYFLSLNV